MTRALLAMVLGLACGRPVAPTPRPAPLAVALAPDAGPARVPATGPVDSDGDGAPDDRDACPAQAEDCDGFADSDGCPDPDNDADGVIDACDKCPFVAASQPDGCPARVVIVHGDPPIKDYVFFDAGSARPRRESGPLIDEIAAVMRDHPEVERVGVVGHASPGERRPEKLGQARADAVVAELVRRGVDAGRLEAHSAGDRDPVASPSKQPERNRRVELEILVRGGEIVHRWDGTHLVRVDEPASASAPAPAPAPASAPIGPCEGGTPWVTPPESLPQICAGP
jgi:OmpA-OmpF porin, OOP family